MADVGVVKYKVELDDSDVGKQADKTQSTLTSKFGGAAAKVGKAALAASAAVATAATAAVVDLTKQAVSAYADYEQLVGGVETLLARRPTMCRARRPVLLSRRVCQLMNTWKR